VLEIIILLANSKCNVALQWQQKMRINKKYFFPILVILVTALLSCKQKEKSIASTLSGEKEVKFKEHYFDACKEKMLGNSEQALKQFQQCLAIDPKNPAVKYEMANVYQYMGLNEDALRYAKEAANSDLKNKWYQQLYIDCLHAKRKHAEAVTVYERMIKNFPPEPELYQNLAQEYMYAGKPEKAIKTYEELEKKFGKDEEVSLRKVTIQKQLKKFDDAEKTFKQLIKDYPNQAQYYTYLGELYQLTKQPEKAFITYQEILKQQPENPYVHLALADYYRTQKKDSLFLEEIKIAFRSEQLEIDNKLKITISFYEMTDLYPDYRPKAYELLEILKKIHPKEAKVWSGYGDFLFRDKKLKDAREAYEKSVLIDDSKYIVWSQLMMCDYELSDFEMLEKHSIKSMDIFPNVPNAYFFNGLANNRLKQYNKAIQSFKEGMEFVYENIPLQIQFLVNLAEAYNTTKQFDKSDESFEDALFLNPNDALVLNNFAYYLSIRKTNLEKAEKMSFKSLEIQPNSISFMDTYAWVLYQQGKYQDAKLWLEKAISKGADNRAVILEHYGDVLFKLNQVDNAVDFWKKAKLKGGDALKLDRKINDKKIDE
jgi:tetratricopeptide (TPR) repeat protein